MNKVFNNLTVFVISTQKEKYNKIKNNLLKEYKNLNIQPIISVYPMSKAFNQMHINCKTKYFLQLDEDMKLNKGTILKLLNLIKTSSFRVVCVTGQLFEKDFGPGGAIKIWKKKIFKYKKFNDCRTVDRDFFKRIYPFKKQEINEIVGIHIPRLNNFLNFSKIIGDICKWKFLKSDINYLHNTLEKIIINRDLIEFIALFLSLNFNDEFICKSKNYQKDKLTYKFFKKRIKKLNSTFFTNKLKIIKFFNLFNETYIQKKKIKKLNNFFLNNIFVIDKNNKYEILKSLDLLNKNLIY
jgi:hypothetical protein